MLFYSTFTLIFTNEIHALNCNFMEKVLISTDRHDIKRILALISDPYHGNKVTKGSILEGAVGLELETLGRLEKIIRDPSGGAEFIDAEGTLWDVKAFRSSVPGNASAFSLDKAMHEIKSEISKKNNFNTLHSLSLFKRSRCIIRKNQL